jgi:hypothetical protein
MSGHRSAPDGGSKMIARLTLEQAHTLLPESEWHVVRGDT